MRKFESQTAHRIKLEAIVVLSGFIKEVGGLIFGFFIAMTAIVGEIYTVLQGHPFLGGSLLFAALPRSLGRSLSPPTGGPKGRPET
jgi:hypothetical protein